MMKEYWFFLETYVFLWYNNEEILVYNTLSGKGFVYKKTEELGQIVKRLADKANLYCTIIKENDFENQSIKDFVSSIRENFCGEIFDKSIHQKKPLVIIPELNINEEFFRSDETEKKIDNSLKLHAEKNLLELTIFLTGQCNLNCYLCNSIYKQIPWCCKNESVLPIESLLQLLSQTKFTSLNYVRFFGGNIFQYPHWDKLIASIKGYSFIKSFYTDYRLLTYVKNQLEIFENEGFLLNIFVDISALKNEIAKEINYNKNFNYIFRATSMEEYEFASEIIEKQSLKSKILPFYNGENLSFFEENIFQNLNEILNTPWGKNEIFANKVLNTNHFGKLIISSNGDIFSNINNEPIGNIESDDIKDIVTKELKQGESWFSTRDKVVPCNNCLYRYLCPSLSNYETTIGKANLCHVNRTL